MDCIPSDDSCDFYLCLESEKQCGFNGYPLRIGYRFCRQIINAKPRTENLKDWFNATRLCLQEKMINKKDLTCPQLAAASVQDHVSCYLNNGYCELSKSQKNYVKRMILRKFFKAPKFILMNARALLKAGCP